MSKVLEAFNKITSGGCKGKYHKYCEIVETELKALEIIKDCNNRCPDGNKVIRFSQYDSESLHIDYLIIGNTCFIITQQEHDLLKEVLL